MHKYVYMYVLYVVYIYQRIMYVAYGSSADVPMKVNWASESD